MAKNTNFLVKMLPERTSVSPLRVIKSDSLIERSLELLRKGVIFGWKRELYLAAGLHNLKLYSPDFLTLCNELSISDTSRKRYLRIGKRLSEIIHTVEHDRSFISEEDIESCINNMVRSRDRLTLRGLDKASSTLPMFTAYLQGEIAPTSDKQTKTVSDPTPLRILSSWDEIEKSVINFRSDLSMLLKYESAQNESDFTKYRSVLTTLDEIRLAVSAYHRGDVKEASSLLTNDLEQIETI